MKPFDDAAYTMAAVSATVALYRALVKKGLLSRDEARLRLLELCLGNHGRMIRRRPSRATSAREVNLRTYYF